MPFLPPFCHGIRSRPHADSEKLFCEEIDVGEEAPLQVASGLQPFYSAEQLEGTLLLRELPSVGGLLLQRCLSLLAFRTVGCS